MHKYCLLIPVLNEGERLKKELDQIYKLKLPLDIVVCDGGSTDGSTQGIKILLHSAPGLSRQLRTGFKYAVEKNYQGIITIDGNGKDDVRDIKKFLAKLEEDFDFVQGSRFLEGGKAINTPLLRLLGIKLLHVPLINFFSGYHYTDTTNGFRGYSKKLVTSPKLQVFREVFQKYNLLFFISYAAPRNGFRVTEVPVTRRYPKNATPTKIKGFFSYWGIFWELVATVLGFYNIPSRS